MFFLVAWTADGAAQIWYPYPYAYRFAGEESRVRLEVTPKEAEVFVDGYYAGIVDDFDGVFQRLRVLPGEHEITLYRDGYRSFTKRVYLMPDATTKIKYAMERLGAGEVGEPRPGPTSPPPNVQGGPPRGPVGPRAPRPPNVPPNPPQGAPPDQFATGTLALRVQPADGEILIDGQPWRGPESQDRFVIDLSQGRHNVQIRKAGYVGYLTDVQIRRGETTTLNVTLRTQP